MGKAGKGLFGLFIILSFITAGAAPPTIIYQPKDLSIILYQPAGFGVIASGTPPLFFQWRKKGVPVSGATNDQFVFSQPQSRTRAPTR